MRLVSLESEVALSGKADRSRPSETVKTDVSAIVDEARAATLTELCELGLLRANDASQYEAGHSVH